MTPNSGPREAFPGLSSREAADQLRTFGENTIAKRKRFRPLIAFFQKFESPLLLLLIGASVVSFFVGERTNAVIIIVMVFVSAVLDFANSYKSEKTVLKLLERVTTTATVMRDGRKKEINQKEIVPGDIVLLAAGDAVPADARVLEAKDCFVNQAALTGESFPVPKYAEEGTDRGGEAPAEQPDFVCMGTNVVTGYATIKVLQTGFSTEFGKIAARVSAETLPTEFEKGIKTFSAFIMRLTFVMVGFVFVANALVGHGVFDSFVFAIAIAIGLTPELLPVIMSVSLSRGSLEMAKKNVIVKNLSSIESFGSMNVLCTDKTGTLTEDRITLVQYVDCFGNVAEDVFTHAYVSSFFHTGIKSPLDKAIREHKSVETGAYKKIDEVPFDFERKRDSIIYKKEGVCTLVTKGAPEDILSIATAFNEKGTKKVFTVAVRNAALAEFEKLSGEGFRVLAVAEKEVSEKGKYTKEDEIDMNFLGFMAFYDPPKSTASSAIKDLEELGIEVKILTGDNEILTQRICHEINLPVKGTLKGPEIIMMNDEELLRRARMTTIFARITPDEKERIILTLKKAGYSVGYLGDGINDAPALKAADVGLSVNNAVDVAKETADIILLEKSLRVLHDGITEGRKTFANTMKYIMMGLSSNFGNMFSMMGASLILPFLPMLPPQILLNNFLYDTSQLTLATDAVDGNLVKKPPRWDIKFVKKFMIVFGPISSIFDFATFGLLLLVFRLPESQFQTGWFIESLATQVFVIYIIRTRLIPFMQSRPSRPLFLNTLLVVVIGWVIPFVGLGAFFSFTSLPLSVLLGIAGIVLAYLVVTEVAKRVFFAKMIL